MDIPTYDIAILQHPDIDFVGIKELESWLNDVLAKYKDLVITEDQCKGIKAELAELNKIKANINEAAKEAIAVLSEPLDAVRKKIGSLTKKIDETYRELKDQVDAFAEEERAKKEELVAQMIDNIFAEYPELGTFDIQVQRKWTNKSTPIKTIEAEIRGIALDELKRRRAEAAEKKSSNLPGEMTQQSLLTTPPQRPEETKKAPATEPEPQETNAASTSSATSVSHDAEKMSITTMQILVTWDSSVDEEVRALLRQVKAKAVSFAARKIA